MTEPLDIAKILALIVAKTGPVEVSRELLDSMMPLRLVLDDRTSTQTIRLSILSNELLTGTVDENQVRVVDFEYFETKKPSEEVVLTSDE